jgi:hypothetical protein
MQKKPKIPASKINDFKTNTMYNDYEGPINFTLVIKGAVSLVAIWFIIVFVGNNIGDIIWKVRNRKNKKN